MALDVPLELEFKKSVSSGTDKPVSIKTFTSYNFDNSIMTPGSAFRFTAPGVDKAERLAIRSGDACSIFATNSKGEKMQVASGIIDETDTHVIANSVEYVLTGRDYLGQLVDNDVELIQNIENVTLPTILKTLIAGTRIPQQIIKNQVPNGTFLFQAAPGETKLSVLQRYLELSNTVVWASPTGRLILGKPNFKQNPSGKLILRESDPTQNNIIEARVRRNWNNSIRTIIGQLQSLDQVDASSYRKINNDIDMIAVRPGLVGRAVYRKWTYGSGTDTVNVVNAVGTQSGNPRKIGDEYALREMAKDNIKILEVECVVQGHINDLDLPYAVDQIYDVVIEDENLEESLYCYHISYEFTNEHGMMTRMKLVRRNCIVAFSEFL